MHKPLPPPFLRPILDDQHLLTVLKKYEANPAAAGLAMAVFEPIVKQWAGACFLGIAPSGSFSKGTAIHPTTDADLFISLDPDTKGTLKEISDSLISWLKRHAIAGAQRHVAVNVQYNGFSIDLVPARRMRGDLGDHAIYRRRDQTWMKTNPITHIVHVLGAGRQREIQLLKIWRHLRNLDIPSFYLELLVIEALREHTSASLVGNLRLALNYIGHNIQRKTIIDPANSNNTVSDELTLKEKAEVAFYANKDAVRPVTEIVS
jgi:hypothetical protein